MLTLNINAKEQQSDVVDDMPLLWVLRNVAHLTGTKFGCGIGAPLRSCVTPASVVAKGQEILTIEGQSIGGSHPVQRALAEFDV